MPRDNSEMENLMNQPNPAPAAPATPPVATPPAPTAPAAPAPGAVPPATPPADPKTPPWGDDKNFNAEKAWELIENLRKETGGGTDALKAQLAAIQEAQENQKKALTAALGLTEPPSSEDALAETVKDLQSKFEASQREAARLRIAAENNIPAEYHSLLTETDPEKLKAQAEMVANLVKANGNPAFQPNPGQGQGGGPATPEAQAAAEYDTYYPPPPTQGK